MAGPRIALGAPATERAYWTAFVSLASRLGLLMPYLAVHIDDADCQTICILLLAVVSAEV